MHMYILEVINNSLYVLMTSDRCYSDKIFVRQQVKGTKHYLKKAFLQGGESFKFQPVA